MQNYKLGKDIKVGDMVFVGAGVRTGRVKEFLAHPELSARNPGWTGRVAVTDRGNVTVIDQQQVRVPAQ